MSSHVVGAGIVIIPRGVVAHESPQLDLEREGMETKCGIKLRGKQFLMLHKKQKEIWGWRACKNCERRRDGS